MTLQAPAFIVAEKPDYMLRWSITCVCGSRVGMCGSILDAAELMADHLVDAHGADAEAVLHGSERLKVDQP